MSSKCDQCGAPLEIGSWPFCPDHGRPAKSKGFQAFVDWNVSDKPVTITTPGDYRKYLKPHWDKDHIVHVQPRDKPASYWRELKDRREARKHASE